MSDDEWTLVYQSPRIASGQRQVDTPASRASQASDSSEFFFVPEGSAASATPVDPPQPDRSTAEIDREMHVDGGGDGGVSEVVHCVINVGGYVRDSGRAGQS